MRGSDPGDNGTMQPELVAGVMTREMRRWATQVGRTRRPQSWLHVGDPEAERVSIRILPWYDPGLPADLITRAMDGLETAERLVWLTRRGDLDVAENDLVWLTAARRASERHGEALHHFHVVTRRGWHELVSGRRVEWPRVRHYHS